MMSPKTVLSFLLPLMVATTATAGQFSVQTWEDSLKASLNSGKTNVAPFFTFEKYEKEALSRKTSADRKLMLEARKLFAADKFDAAIAKYNQIDKGSDYWLEAVEEKGWAYHRKGDFEKALAQTKTLLAEPLVQVSGSEGFFLQSLSQLKICDYPGIFKTHQAFKDTQKARVAAIEALAQTGTSPALMKAVEKAENFPLTFDQVGNEAKELPFLFYRDLEVQKQMLKMKLTARGIALLQGKDSASIALLQKANAVAEGKLKARVKTLAQAEDKKNQLMLQKLGLIEVETIQRMHADKNVDQETYASGKFAKVSADDLVFPDDGMPWVDELDKYEVMANTCPRNVRRKM